MAQSGDTGKQPLATVCIGAVGEPVLAPELQGSETLDALPAGKVLYTDRALLGAYLNINMTWPQNLCAGGNRQHMNIPSLSVTLVSYVSSFMNGA